jgi:hypothetical protein
MNLKFLTVSKVNTDRCNFAFFRELFYFAGDSLFHKEHPFFYFAIVRSHNSRNSEIFSRIRIP